MEPGRYVLQQEWDNNSALEGYNAVNESDFRAGGSYSGRRYLDEGYSRESVYARSTFQRDVHERDIYPPPPPATSIWPQPKRNFDDEYALLRESRRHESFHEMDYRDAEKYHEIDSFHGVDKFRDNYHNVDSYYETDSHRDYDFDRHARMGGRDRDEIVSDYELRHRISHQSRESSREREYDYDRYNYDSDHERGRRDSTWRRRESRDREREKRGLSREKDQSPYRHHDRSRSHGHEDRSRSRSPRGRSSRSHREDSYDDSRYERSDRRRDHDRDERRHADSVAPSATVVVKGLSQNTSEEDLYQILAEWGPLRHVRVIKERNSGISRGFAFIDFPTVEAARNMMNGIGENGLMIDGRKLFFEYRYVKGVLQRAKVSARGVPGTTILISSKPTGGAGAPSLGQESFTKSTYGHNRITTAPFDWMCTICGCVNFARRTSCFQCNEPRTDDAPPADISASSPAVLGKRGPEAGPTHVLVVRGLDENADEEMLRYEFAKHSAIKDLRLVRDKFTHVSRGFAFIHFHSVEDATRALEATNGITLEKNGQVLRVAYAKSIHGPGSGAPQSSSLAAAAIEAATFAQQYDAVGWTPKEYNPDDKQSANGHVQNAYSDAPKGGSASQSGFVWDEKSGYYYDASSGFYYDGNTGLYYDGNTGIWYTYDLQTQNYVPCGDQSNNKAANELAANELAKTSDGNSSRKVVISAPAATIKPNEKASLPDAVQAAANAALAAEKKEKEKSKEIKLASKSSLLANKKKMNNVLAMWKQRNHEGQQGVRFILDDKDRSSLTDKHNNPYNASVSLFSKSKSLSDLGNAKDASTVSGYSSVVSRGAIPSVSTQAVDLDPQIKPRPVSNSSGGTIMGVIRGSGRGVVKSDTTFPTTVAGTAVVNIASTASTSGSLVANTEAPSDAPFKTDASALGSYASSGSVGSGKRRFSETPVQSTYREQSQVTYRDRAAERRNLYGSASSKNNLSDLGDSTCDYPYRKGSSTEIGSMPFPPGVGGRGAGETISNAENYEVITADRAIDESNVGNRILRNMGWQEGLGLGKDGSGIKEPVQAKAVDDRAGLGSQQRKVDPLLEAQAGDSYRTIIQKKAIARFREMS